jgi:hypothetical protein
MKNWLVAEFGSEVRAMDRVPRVFCRPLLASFLIGPWFLLLHLVSETAALDHEARDHAVENRVVVETAVDVLQEILGTDRRLDGVQLDFDLAEAGVQQDVRRLVRP